VLQRLVGNAAVTEALRRQPPAHLPRLSRNQQYVPVQRAAWVADRRVDPSEENLSPRMQELAKDSHVHEYRSNHEFRAHADNKTDYLGNLKSHGTWLRFSPSGLTVVGERHTDQERTLPDVVRAVGTSSFIYELFPSDDLSSYPATMDMVRQTGGDRISMLGLDQNADLRQYGAESLFPKIGGAFRIVLPKLRGTGKSELDGWTGKVFQRYLKIAWAYAGEVHAEVQSRQQGSIRRAVGRLSAHRRAQEQVSRAYADLHLLGAFIANLQHGDSIGTSLARHTGPHPGPDGALLQELESFGRSIIELMRQKVSQTPGLGLVDQVRLPHSGDPFTRTRNLSFQANVLAAQQRGVRYAGMGALHLDFLRQTLGNRDGIHFYDLTGDEYDRDRARTDRREQQLEREASRRTARAQSRSLSAPAL
jgi:hypothetical protein